MRSLPVRLALVALAVALLGGALWLSGESQPPPSPDVSPSPSAAATASSEPSQTPSGSPAGASVALVPVVGFWSPIRSITRAQLAAALEGKDKRFRQTLLAAPDATVVAAALGISPGSSRSASSAAVLNAVTGTTDVLGVVRASDVRPSVRALAIDGKTLFGNARLQSLDGWPLSIATSAVPATAFDPQATWTLVAAGDVMLDREVYRRSVSLGGGPDYPWNGGTASIIARGCCRVGQPTITTRRTGNAGAVRDLFLYADLALVNHEGPTPDAFSYHPHGFDFSFDPALEAGLQNAGIDAVSLANNHARNAGASGVSETIRNLDARGIAHAGAGNNLAGARAPAWLTAGGNKVAMLAYDAIDIPTDAAGPSRAGVAPLSLAAIRADIRAARAAGADVVIVVPHWGIEYTARPTALQRRQAAAIVAAGADVILGAHTHWVGGIESIDDRLAVYSMGDFIFDLPRSEQTLEGVVVELTFAGRRLLQADLHPTVIIDRSQPNLLDPSRDGRVVLDRMRRASSGFLGW